MLVVDDYGDVRELIAEVLRNAGFVVRTAANGLEGLLAAYEMRPAVIVMDFAMPVLDGLEATRLIKASEAMRQARVIAYTSTPRRVTVWLRSYSRVYWRNLRLRPPFSQWFSTSRVFDRSRRCSRLAAASAQEEAEPLSHRIHNASFVPLPFTRMRATDFPSEASMLEDDLLLLGLIRFGMCRCGDRSSWSFLLQ